MHSHRQYETLDETLEGLDVPQDIREALELVSVTFFGFDGQVHDGQLVVHTDLAHEVRDIFDCLLASAFPIERIVPVNAYGFDDDASMRDNNTSAFNYRMIAGTDRLSNHSLGRAIDINPRLNPSYLMDGTVLPGNGTYAIGAPGTVAPGSLVVQLFKERGWRWLGEREGNPDYQHFDRAA